MSLIKIVDLKKHYKTPAGNLHAVDLVNLQIDEGSTLGVVGESGCGKSTLGRAVLRLIEPTSGEIWFSGENILSYSKEKMRKARRDMQIIFQDPYASLNPRLTVSELIAEPLIVHKVFGDKKERQKKIAHLMDTVELSERFTYAYPHELDGVRRQRIGIARALALEPKFIVCDEPVSALDVSIQAQILNLMMDLQDELGLTYMFISHNLSVVRHISKEIAVMYLGQCVELAPADELFNNPQHPYTQALLDAIPIPNLSVREKKRKILQGEVTSPINPAPGCRFASRCPNAAPECRITDIPLKECAPGHFVSCVKSMSNTK
ncbi:MAG: ATP-binding cassette domain-containing protein [Defluviitaleaceae bacterium]|nr:ATP-binding cassette domain-containing protein [Defluviitaleaceae bacterium]